MNRPTYIISASACRHSNLRFLLIACCALLHPCLIGMIWAGSELDDVLSGFDDSTPNIEAKESDDVGDMDGLLDGFDDADEVEEVELSAAESSRTTFPSWLDPFGSFSIMGTWNFAHDAPDEGDADFRDLSMLRTTGALGVDVDMGSWQARISGHAFYDAAYSIQGRDQYTTDLLDDYEQEYEFDEVYLEGSLLSNMDLKIGRQIVVWGKADNLRVTDILNPLDNRIRGMVDIKYKRLPVTMSKLDYYTGPWNISTIVINEVRFDKNPVYNSDFYPGDTAAVTEIEPNDFDLDTQQYAMAVNGIFSGWDLSFYQAWVYDSRAHLTEENGTFTREHNRVSMSGMTGNIAFGNWLLKGESAFWADLEYGGAPDESFERLDLMTGVEYTGFTETVLSIEFVNRHIIDFDERLESSPDYQEQDIQQTALMFSRDFANDTNQIKLICSIFGTFGDGGAFERLQFTHDINDSMSLTTGVILYQSGDMQAFSQIEDNDRLFLEYVYSF